MPIKERVSTNRITPEDALPRNDDQFKIDLSTASDAAIGVIGIRTRELYRASEVIQLWAIQNERTFRTWTLLDGWQEYPTISKDGELPDDFNKPTKKGDSVVDVVAAIEAIKGMPDPGVYVMFAPQWAFNAPDMQQAIRAFVRHALEQSQRLIFVMPSSAEIIPLVQDDIYLLDFKTPGPVELREQWDALLATVAESARPEFSELEVDDIIQNASGMSNHEFDTALAIAFVQLKDDIADGDATPADFIKVLLRFKVDMLKRTNILELMPPGNMDDVGGMDLLKTYLAKQRRSMRPAARLAGIDQPKGIVLVGPPGGGKSLLARAVGSLMNLPTVKFNIDAVFGGLVGSSEANMRFALDMIDSIAPCVLYIDEIDKAFAGTTSGGDSGTSARVLGKFLTWVVERVGQPVYAMVTANNVVGLPPELLRKGRFDEIWAATFPDVRELKHILKIHLNKRGQEMSEADMTECAERMLQYVGSEVESMVKEAVGDCYDEDTGTVRKVTKADIFRYIALTTPLSQAFPEKVKAMNDWADKNARPVSTGMDFTSVPQAVSARPKDGLINRAAKLPPRTGPIKPRTTDN